MQASGVTHGTDGGFTFVEVVVSLALLALLAGAVFGVVQSTHRQMRHGTVQLEAGHAVQAAVEHFKAHMRMAGPPAGGCPPALTNDYCYKPSPHHWALYDYGDYDDVHAPSVLLVNLSVHASGADAQVSSEVAVFSFLASAGGF